MENIGYLFSDAARLLRRRFDERVRAHGVTGPQARLMLMVNGSSGMTQTHYAEQMDVEPITLCRMVDRMEEAGLIERRLAPNDRRARLLQLTASGKSRITELEKDVSVLIEDLRHGLTQAQQDIFLDVLTTIRENLLALDSSQEAAHG